MKIRVVSYNIHKGFSWANTSLVLSRIKELIREVNGDVIFLQEVLGEHKKHSQKFSDWPMSSQFEYLADDVWAHFAYGQNAVYEDGNHGNAILSHFPIQEWKNTNISTNRFESRGFLYAKIEVPFKNKVEPIHLICLHLDLFEHGRKQQIQSLCHFVKQTLNPVEPLIIAGDFNDWTGRSSSFLEKQIDAREVFYSKTKAYAKTFPAFFPLLSLDRIFVRNIKIKDCCVLNNSHDLSDHAPLFVELELD